MKFSHLNTLAKIAFIIFAYLTISYFYFGISSTVREGDSINYHIPIAQSYLDGTVFNPATMKHGDPYLKYSPGSSEAILALFILSHIPINLYNVLAIIVLFIVSFKFGTIFKLNNDTAIIFASSIATLHGILRWVSTQIIDIWLLIFFITTIILLEKPQNKFSYFLKLGFSFGMLAGSKYFGLFFAVVLMLIYGKLIIKFIDWRKLIAFIIPFFIFGCLWYIRNYLLKHNPSYPQPTIFFRNSDNARFGKLAWQVWKVMLISPGWFLKVLNALLGEYLIWSLTLIFTPVILFFAYVNKSKKIDPILRLTLTGLFCFIVWLFLPSTPQDNIIISVFRYSYPAIVPLILGLFLLASKFNKLELISVIAITNMLVFPELIYHPKILLILLPAGLLFYYYDVISTGSFALFFKRLIIHANKVNKKM